MNKKCGCFNTIMIRYVYVITIMSIYEIMFLSFIILFFQNIFIFVRLFLRSTLPNAMLKKIYIKQTIIFQLIFFILKPGIRYKRMNSNTVVSYRYIITVYLRVFLFIRFCSYFLSVPTLKKIKLLRFFFVFVLSTSGRIYPYSANEVYR